MYVCVCVCVCVCVRHVCVGLDMSVMHVFHRLYSATSLRKLVIN